MLYAIYPACTPAKEYPFLKHAIKQISIVSELLFGILNGMSLILLSKKQPI